MRRKNLINESIDYIMEHFDEGISIEDVADHFHFSKYYFCRTFKEVTGESIYSFMKRLKMDQSAIDIMIDKTKSIMDIGLDYGYSSSNYSSAFRKHHNISPYEFRKTANAASKQNPFNPMEIENFEAFDDYDSRIKVQVIDDIMVFYERMFGNYVELKERWFHFMDTYKDYMKVDTLMIERFYDDPSITSLNRCLCDLCMSVDETCELDSKAIIKGGKYAIYRYEGEIPNIFRTLQGIFSIWLPDSGYQMDERYGLNIYREIDKVSEHVVMDLCIPIR